jgi:STE24 endopeptidase
VNLDARGASDAQLVLDFTPPDFAPWIQAIQKMFGGTPQDINIHVDYEGSRFWRARSTDAFSRHGLMVNGQIQPAPLADLLRSYQVEWLTITVRHPYTPDTLFQAGPGTYTRSGGDTWHYAAFRLNSVAESQKPLRLAYGYRSEDLLKLLAPLAFLLLLPVGITLWLRRMALRAGDADPSAVWFGYARLSQFTILAMWLLWAGTFYWLGANRFAGFLTNSATAQGRAASSALLYGLPPALICILCVALSHPVYVRVRGAEWTRGDLMRQMAWGLLATLLPLLFVAVGSGALIDEQPRLFALWLLLAYISRVISVPQLLKATDITRQTLTVGELRDSLFALAEKAGVRIKQVHFLQTGKGRMANAFAMRGNNVLLTDYLLQNLSKREVNAVAAHELAHLRHRHPLWLQVTGVLAIGLPVGVLVGLESARWMTPGLADLLFPACILLGLMLIYFLSRRFERVADAGAVKLTGDAEALITALTKINRFNRIPMEWGKWSERMLTHPSTLRRAEALAAQGAISLERLQELLRAPDTGEAHYPLPAALTSNEQIFSTAFKSKNMARISWLLVATIALTPALVLAGAKALLGTTALPLWAYAGALLAAVALFRLALNYLPCLGYADLPPRLKYKLAPEGIRTEAWDGVFVSFAPDAQPRLYEGYTHWDIGFLFLTGNRLCYIGEQSRFALTRDQVTAIRSGVGPPGWWRVPNLTISWRDAACGTEGTFQIRPAYGRSLGQNAREVPKMLARLQAWQAREPAAPDPLPALDTPAVGAVTSASPRTLGTAPVLVRMLILLALCAAGASALCGLSFDWKQGGAAWYVILIAAFMAVLQWLPYRRYHDSMPERNERR